MSHKWLESEEAFRRYLEERGGFDESIGLTQEVARTYQSRLFAGSTRETAFHEATEHLHLNAITVKYVRDVLENLPGPEDV
jgi:hypothetical protein